jgi:hypothetical protein
LLGTSEASGDLDPRDLRVRARELADTRAVCLLFERSTYGSVAIRRADGAHGAVHELANRVPGASRLRV